MTNKAAESRKARESRDKQARLNEMKAAVESGTLVIRHDPSVIKTDLPPRKRRSRIMRKA